MSENDTLEVFEYDEIKLMEGGYCPTVNLAWIRQTKFGGTELCQLWESTYEDLEDIWVRVRSLI